MQIENQNLSQETQNSKGIIFINYFDSSQRSFITKTYHNPQQKSNFIFNDHKHPNFNNKQVQREMIKELKSCNSQQLCQKVSIEIDQFFNNLHILQNPNKQTEMRQEKQCNEIKLFLYRKKKIINEGKKDLMSDTKKKPQSLRLTLGKIKQKSKIVNKSQHVLSEKQMKVIQQVANKRIEQSLKRIRIISDIMNGNRVKNMEMKEEQFSENIIGNDKEGLDNVQNVSELLEIFFRRIVEQILRNDDKVTSISLKDVQLQRDIKKVNGIKQSVIVQLWQILLKTYLNININKQLQIQINSNNNIPSQQRQINFITQLFSTLLSSNLSLKSLTNNNKSQQQIKYNNLVQKIVMNTLLCILNENKENKNVFIFNHLLCLIINYHSDDHYGVRMNKMGLLLRLFNEIQMNRLIGILQVQIVGGILILFKTIIASFLQNIDRIQQQCEIKVQFQGISGGQQQKESYSNKSVGIKSFIELYKCVISEIFVPLYEDFKHVKQQQNKLWYGKFIYQLVVSQCEIQNVLKIILNQQNRTNLTHHYGYGILNSILQLYIYIISSWTEQITQYQQHKQQQYEYFEVYKQVDWYLKIIRPIIQLMRVINIDKIVYVEYMNFYLKNVTQLYISIRAFQQKLLNVQGGQQLLNVQGRQQLLNVQGRQYLVNVQGRQQSLNVQGGQQLLNVQERQQLLNVQGGQFNRIEFQLMREVSNSILMYIIDNQIDMIGHYVVHSESYQTYRVISRILIEGQSFDQIWLGINKQWRGYQQNKNIINQNNSTMNQHYYQLNIMSKQQFSRVLISIKQIVDVFMEYRQRWTEYYQVVTSFVMNSLSNKNYKSGEYPQVLLYLVVIYAYSQSVTALNNRSYTTNNTQQQQQVNSLTLLLNNLQVHEQHNQNTKIIQSIEVNLYTILNNFVYSNASSTCSHQLSHQNTYQQLINILVLKYISLMWEYIYVKKDSYKTIKLPYIQYVVKQQHYQLLSQHMFQYKQQQINSQQNNHQQINSQQNNHQQNTQNSQKHQLQSTPSQQNILLNQLFAHLISQITLYKENQQSKLTKIISKLQPTLCGLFLNHLYNSQQQLTTNIINTQQFVNTMVVSMVKNNIKIQSYLTFNPIIKHFLSLNLQSYCYCLLQFYYKNQTIPCTDNSYYLNFLWQYLLIQFTSQKSTNLINNLYISQNVSNILYFYFQNFKLYTKQNCQSGQLIVFYSRLITGYLLKNQEYCLSSINEVLRDRKDIKVILRQIQQHNRRVNLQLLIIQQMIQTIGENKLSKKSSQQLSLSIQDQQKQQYSKLKDDQLKIFFSEYMKMFQLAKSSNRINPYSLVFSHNQIPQMVQSGKGGNRINKIKIQPIHYKFISLSKCLYILCLTNKQSEHKEIQYKQLSNEYTVYKQSTLIEEIKSFLRQEMSEILYRTKSYIQKMIVNNDDKQSEIIKLSELDYCGSVGILFGFTHLIIQYQLKQAVYKQVDDSHLNQYEFLDKNRTSNQFTEQQKDKNKTSNQLTKQQKSVITLWKYYQKSISQLIQLTTQLKLNNNRQQINQNKHKPMKRSFTQKVPNYNFNDDFQSYKRNTNTYQSINFIKTKQINKNTNNDIKTPIDNYLTGLNNLQTTKNKSLFLLTITIKIIISSSTYHQNQQQIFNDKKNTIIQQISKITTVNQLLQTLSHIKSLITQFQSTNQNIKKQLQQISKLLDYLLSNIQQLKTCIAYRIQCFNTINQKQSKQINSNKVNTNIQEISTNKLIGRKVFKILPLKTQK